MVRLMVDLVHKFSMREGWRVISYFERKLDKDRVTVDYLIIWCICEKTFNLRYCFLVGSVRFS